MKISVKILSTILVLSTIIFFVINPKKTISDVTFTTLNGEQLSFEKLRGKPVIVTFWATDCASCLQEIPLWIDLYSRFHTQGLEIIAVSMNYDPPNHVVELVKKRALPYLVTLDIEAKLAHAFDDVQVTPTNFLLNQDGKIVWHKVGLVELAELESKIKTLLKEN